jgi:hypothetical protein
VAGDARTRWAEIFTIIVGVLAVLGFIGVRGCDSGQEAKQVSPTDTTLSFTSLSTVVPPTSTSFSTTTNATTTTVRPSSTTTEPTPMTLSDTPTGTVLDIGQTWRSGNKELAIPKITFKDYGGRIDDIRGAIDFVVQFRNRGSTPVTFNYVPRDVVTAVDNRNDRLIVTQQNLGLLGYYPCHDSQQTRIVNPGETVELNCVWFFVVGVDLGNPAISQVVISVAGVSTIPTGRWKIPIAH